jgi:hypothetical protein
LVPSVYLVSGKGNQGEEELVILLVIIKLFVPPDSRKVKI